MPPRGSRGVALALIDGVPVGDLPKRNNINRGGDEYGHRPFTGIHQCRAFADLRQRFVILFVFNHQCGGRGLRSGKNEPYQTVTFRSGEHEFRLGQVPWFGCRADACIVFQPILVIDVSPAMLLHRKTCPVVLMNAQVRLVNAELTRLVERKPQADCGISTAAILRDDAIAYVPGSDTQIVVQAMPQIEDSHIRTLIIDENAMCPQVRSDNEALYRPETGKSCPTEILEVLAKYNAEGRPIWKPMHMQPMYRLHECVGREGSLRCRTNAYIAGGVPDVGADIFRRGLCLPSDNKLTEEQVDGIIALIHACFA